MTTKRGHTQIRSTPGAVTMLAAGLFCILPAAGQSIRLDGFENLDGWTPIVSQGAHLDLVQSRGKTGGAMEMEFDLRGVNGYAIAQKKFSLDVPADYEFTFDLRADAPDNNFEFKLIDDHENVYWLKKLNVEYPLEWTKERIKKRRISFAWGPDRGRDLRTISKIEFVVSTGRGGRGEIFISNFRFEAINPGTGKGARAEILGLSESGCRIDSAGDILENWTGTTATGDDSLVVNFHRHKEVGGLVIDWDAVRCSTSYDVLLSDDGKEWSTAYKVSNGNGDRDYICLAEGEGNFLKLLFHTYDSRRPCRIKRLVFTGPEFSSSPNAFFRAVSADSPPGYYPKYFGERQSYWTVIGLDGDSQKALVNEEGQVEVGRGQWSLEPFVSSGGRLVTWHDVALTQSLLDGDLPIPSVRWNYGNLWTLTVQALAAGDTTRALLLVHYSLTCTAPSAKGTLFVAVRPFQVYPPWQTLNLEGGAARIDSMAFRGGILRVNTMRVVPSELACAFGAAEFDQGSVTEYLCRGILPPVQEVHDHFRHASGAFGFDFSLSSGERKDVVIAVPFRGWDAGRTDMLRAGLNRGVYDSLRAEMAGFWRRTLNTFNLMLPAAAEEVSNTFKTSLAYILVNRLGAALQPGTRSYDRSWIRDGSLICSALLATGHAGEVRKYLDWYAGFQFPDGKIPCVVDHRGADATPEHDSNGEFIYAVSQYFRYTLDTAWLRGKFDRVVKTMRFIQSLRKERKTARYRSGTPEQRACYGLVPESISHEGYSDAPRHSYWDDFFILRGLKDAATIAGVLGETGLAREFGKERDDFRNDLYASMRLAMRNHRIDYIPGCVELGDFDPTSTTVGIAPGGELGNIPEPALHDTFEKYFQDFTRRETDTSNRNYTPYEMRVIGTFVLLEEKERAKKTLEFFMKDRRPSAWNEWAEVVWRDRDSPHPIGDMPHAWVGSDFMRSVLAMVGFERERDRAFVLCAGIPDEWINDAGGVGVENLRTPYGSLTYSLRRYGDVVSVDIAGTFDARRHVLLLHPPLRLPPKRITIGSRKRDARVSGDVRVDHLPMKIEFEY